MTSLTVAAEKLGRRAGRRQGLSQCARLRAYRVNEPPVNQPREPRGRLPPPRRTGTPRNVSRHLRRRRGRCGPRPGIDYQRCGVAQRGRRDPNLRHGRTQHAEASNAQRVSPRDRDAKPPGDGAVDSGADNLGDDPAPGQPGIRGFHHGVAAHHLTGDHATEARPTEATRASTDHGGTEPSAVAKRAAVADSVALRAAALPKSDADAHRRADLAPGIEHRPEHDTVAGRRPSTTQCWMGPPQRGRTSKANWSSRTSTST